jgi:hypothetical protein
MGSMFGIVPTSAGLGMAALLLAIPFAIGLSKNMRSRLSMSALCVADDPGGGIFRWLHVSQFRDDGRMQSYFLHLPLQVVFNLLLMIVVPAATIRLLQRFLVRQ